MNELFPGAEKIDTQYIEHMLGRGIELEYNKNIGTVIDKLVKQNTWWLDNCYAITEEEKEFFALWAGHQFVRSTAFREVTAKMQQAFSQMISDFANRNVPEDEKIVVKARTDKFAKQAMHADILLNSDFVPHFAETMIHHSWIFAVNRSGISFVTSDNPTTIIPHDFSRGLIGAGLKSPKVEVFFPLSPQVAIMMYEKQHELGKLDRRCIEITNPDVVKQYNYASLYNAIRIIISNTKDLFYLQEHARQHPEIREKYLNVFVGGKEYKF